MNTALIIRPANMPEVRVLEVDGPLEIPRVHHFPGSFQPVMSFEEYCALPDHQTQPGLSAEMRDFDSAARISRLLANEGHSLDSRQIREIQFRLELLFPGCTGDALRTIANQPAA